MRKICILPTDEYASGLARSPVLRSLILNAKINMARVLICPEFELEDLDDLEFVSLPHPNTNEPVLFLIEKTLGIMQIQLVENKINSWVVDETIIKGCFYSLTKMETCISSQLTM